MLAGGRASRLGGAPKPSLLVGGTSLLDLAIEGVAGVGGDPITVVGEAAPVARPVRFVREHPPFGGPVAAIAAALDDWAALPVAPEWALVVPGDVPRLASAVRALVAAPSGDADGAGLVDAQGRHRLVMLVRTSTLAERVAALPERGRDARVAALLRRLDLVEVLDADGLADDVDTWQDLDRARDAALTGGDAVMDETDAALDAWVGDLRERYGLAEGDVPVEALLALAGDAAHGIVRPAAPLTTYVAGLLAGRSGADPAQVRAIVEELAVLTRRGGA